MPTNRDEAEQLITTILEAPTSSETIPEVFTCDHCLYERDSSIHYYRYKFEAEDGEIKIGKVCQTCRDESDSLNMCTRCEYRMPDTYSETCEQCDDYYCFECLDEHNHNSNCSICNEDYDQEDGRYIPEMDAEICQNCIDTYLYYCRGHDSYHENDRKPSISSISNTYCQQYVTENPERFARSVETGQLLDILTNEAIQVGTRMFIEYETARQRTEERQFTLAIRQLSILQSEIRQRIEDKRATINKRKYKRSAGEIIMRLANKAQSDLRKVQPQEISPAHNQIYIGMEIEAFGGNYAQAGATVNTPKGSYFMGPNKVLSLELPKHTRLVHDGSIRGNNGQEFLPPVVKKDADWNKIKKVVETLKAMNWSTNDSCGIHFHFSHARLTSDQPENIRKIFRLFYYLEPLIFKLLPENRRDNEFCQPLAKYFSKEEIEKNLKLDYWYYANFWKKRVRRNNDTNRHPDYYAELDFGGVQPVRFGDGKFGKTTLDISKKDHYYVGRYIGCNLHSLFTKGTIELRYFPSNIDFNYIYAWAKAMTAIFQYVLDNKPTETIKGIMEEQLKPKETINKLAKELKWDESIVQFLQSQLSTHKRPSNTKVRDEYAPQEQPQTHQRIAQSLSERIPIPALREQEQTPRTARGLMASTMEGLMRQTAARWTAEFIGTPMQTRNYVDELIQEESS